MGTVQSLAITLEELLAHLLGRDGRDGRYEFACPSYWDDGQLIIVLRDRHGGQAREPTDEEVVGPVKRLLQKHRNVVVGDSPVGMVEVADVAVGKRWEKQPKYAGWIALFLRPVGMATRRGSERDDVINVSFGPRS